MHGFRRGRGAGRLPAAALLCLAVSCGSAAEAESPVSVRLVDGWIEVHNARPDHEARFLTFERRGESVAYGVYGAHSEKSSMRVPTPLGGDPIAWPERDHAQAVAYLLEIHGASPEEARVRVEREGPEWFREGLRVFVFAPDALRVQELER